MFLTSSSLHLVDREKDVPKAREAIYVLLDLLSVSDLCMLLW